MIAGSRQVPDERLTSGRDLFNNQQERGEPTATTFLTRSFQERARDATPTIRGMDHPAHFSLVCVKDEEGEEPHQVSIGVVEKVVQLVCRAITQQTPDQLHVESFVLIAQVGEALNLAYLGSEQSSAFDQTVFERSRHAFSFIVERRARG